MQKQTETGEFFSTHCQLCHLLKLHDDVSPFNPCLLCRISQKAGKQMLNDPILMFVFESYTSKSVSNIIPVRLSSIQQRHHLT